MLDVFASWLYSVAFDSNGLIMKHALDVCMLMDRLGHDPELGLSTLIPVCTRKIQLPSLIII